MGDNWFYFLAKGHSSILDASSRFNQLVCHFSHQCINQFQIVVFNFGEQSSKRWISSLNDRLVCSCWYLYFTILYFLYVNLCCRYEYATGASGDRKRERNSFCVESISYSYLSFSCLCWTPLPRNIYFGEYYFEMSLVTISTQLDDWLISPYIHQHLFLTAFSILLSQLIGDRVLGHLRSIS